MSCSLSLGLLTCVQTSGRPCPQINYKQQFALISSILTTYPQTTPLTSFTTIHFKIALYWIIVNSPCVSCSYDSKVIQLYVYIYPSFSRSFPRAYYRILSSLCYRLGPCWLSILYTAVCICQSQTPKLPNPLQPPPLKSNSWESAGCPVIRTQSFHCPGLGFSPWSGN